MFQLRESKAIYMDYFSWHCRTNFTSNFFTWWDRLREVKVMASVAQRGKRPGCRPLASGSGHLAAAQSASNTPSKAGIWSILLLQDTVLGSCSLHSLCVFWETLNKLLQCDLSMGVQYISLIDSDIRKSRLVIVLQAGAVNICGGLLWARGWQQKCCVCQDFLNLAELGFKSRSLWH